jgi:hypothetical protein
MIRRGSSRPCCVVPGCSWWSFSEPSLGCFLGCFRDLALGDLMGEICGNPSWFFELDFGVFGVLGLEEVLAGFLRFLLFGQVLVGLNLAMDSS